MKKAVFYGSVSAMVLWTVLVLIAMARMVWIAFDVVPGLSPDTLIYGILALFVVLGVLGLCWAIPMVGVGALAYALRPIRRK